MTGREHIISQLALLMWNDERTDSIQGMTATGLLVRNRVRAGWMGGDWLRVIDTYDDYRDNPRGLVKEEKGDVNDPLFRRVLFAAEAIYCGTEKDITAGALYGANLAETKSERFLTEIVRNTKEHPRVSQIGKRQFFK